MKREDFQDLYPVAVVVEEENTAAGHLLRLHHRLQVCQQAHVFAHVRRQHHVDHHLPEGGPLLGRQASQDVTLRQLQQLEGNCQVMVLQNGLVVVHQGQLRASGYQVLVRRSRVVDVVHGGGQNSSKHLQGGEHLSIES